MKIGALIQRLQHPLFECLGLAAKMGLDGVQLYAVSRQENLLESRVSLRREIVERCAELGVEIPSICGEVGGYGLRLKNRNRERCDMLKRCVDLACDLGAETVSSHIGVVPPDRNDPIYEAIVDALREVGFYAGTADISIGIETGSETPEALRRLLEDIGSPGISINFDPANLVMVIGEDPVKAVQALRGHILHTHAKDGIHYRDCDPVRVYDAFANGGIKHLVEETGELFAEKRLGQGQIDWSAYLKALMDTGYNGFLTIEREVGPEPERDMRDAIHFLRNKLKELEHVQSKQDIARVVGLHDIGQGASGRCGSTD